VSARAAGVSEGFSADTIYATLRSAAARLPRSPTPILDAEELLAHVLGVSRTALLARGTDGLPAGSRAAFDRLLTRRAAGEPVAYLTGRVWFYGLELEVTPAVLIPRPETEALAEWAIGWAQARGGPLGVLDVGTGSGALALALAANVPVDLTIHATDVAPAALDVARRNALRFGLAERITFHQADLLPPAPPAFDLVVANLPYVGTDELADVAPDVLLWEPHAALFAGPGGLALIRRLLGLLPGRLSAGAAVGLEIGWRQGAAVVALARAAFPGARVTLRPDLAGLDRIVTIQP